MYICLNVMFLFYIHVYDWWGLLAQSVELKTWDCRVPGLSFILGSRLCPWARHFVHIA